MKQDIFYFSIALNQTESFDLEKHNQYLSLIKGEGEGGGVVMVFVFGQHEC